MSNLLDFRLAIKLKLMELLYQEQMKYWNTRLMRVSRMNKQAHGRWDRLNYAVYFNDKVWRPEHLDWTKNDESAYCLELHPSNPELAAEMRIISEELGEIEEERYEADRFLSGLVLFKCPPNVFHQVLGDTLYAPCRREFEEFCSQYPTSGWDRNGEFSMNIFVEKNKNIITAMKERLLVNLVTKDERR